MGRGLAIFSNNYRPAGGGGGSFDVGRSASNGKDGNFASFTISLPGAAPVAGSWIILIGCTNTGAMTPSGGTNGWTQIATANLGGQQAWIHECAASEPSSYTITYSGANKADSCEVSIVEIVNGNATNPDDVDSATATATNASSTSSAANDIAVIGWAKVSGSIPTAPSGYTLQTSGTNVQGPCSAALATKKNVGSGTISPGNWSASGDLLVTVLLKS